MKKRLVGLMVGLSVVSMLGGGVKDFSLPVLALDYLGQQEAEFADSGISKEMVIDAATAIFEGMQMSDSGMLEGYKFSTVSDAKRVLLHLNFEILNGKTSPIRIYKQDGGYRIGWEDGDAVIAEHLKGSEYVASAWEGIAERVGELESENDKAKCIARYICEELILGYDFDENGNVAKDATRSIYDLSISEDNKAVCIVYATLFDRLCEKAGIQCEVVVGIKGADSNESHSWNRVIVDGRETYFDLTNYAQVRSEAFFDMVESGHYEMGEYREYENHEFGYRAAINSVDKGKDR